MAKQNTVKKKKNSKFGNFLFGLILLLGAGVISYPSVSNWWNQRHQTQAIADYVETVNSLSDADMQYVLDEAREFNRKLGTGISVGLTDEEYAEYEKILDVTGTGIMGYIQIPDINVNLPIYHGVDENVLEIAVGHVPGSSFPVGGEGTHAALSGHRGLPTANLFTDLDELKEGNKFTITILNELLTYEIDQIRIVLPQDVSNLAIEPGKDYVTLITCTPYGVNSHRMLVRGKRVDNDAVDSTQVVNEARKLSPTFMIGGIAIPLIIISMIVSVASSGARSKRKTGKALLKELEEASIEAGGKKR